MESRQIILAGIGMGSKELITAEVRKLIEEADCLIGAERMLASLEILRKSVQENAPSIKNIERKRSYLIFRNTKSISKL